MRILKRSVNPILLSIAILAFAGLASGQGSPDTAAVKPDDVGSMDAIVKAYYEVVSGPAGEAPDYKRDAALHHPDALISVASVDSDGKPALSTMSLKGFYDRFGGTRQTGFYEWELHRRVERFGNIANVWSTYAASETPKGKPFMRGVNNIQLFFDGERWWIMSWIYDTERPGNPIPAEYLPEK